MYVPLWAKQGFEWIFEMPLTSIKQGQLTEKITACVLMSIESIKGIAEKEEKKRGHIRLKVKGYRVSILSSLVYMYTAFP